MVANRIVSRWLVYGLAISGVSLASGQEVREQVGVQQRVQTTSTTQVRRVSSVLQANVRVEGGDQIGRVEDVVINDSGCVEFVVISYEDKYLVVPWTITTVSYEQKVVTLDITRDRLAQAPTFTRNNWSYLSNPQWVRRVQTFYSSDSGRRDRRSEGDLERRATERRGARRSAPEDREARTRGPRSGSPDQRPLGEPPSGARESRESRDRDRGADQGRPNERPPRSSGAQDRDRPADRTIPRAVEPRERPTDQTRPDERAPRPGAGSPRNPG